MVVSFEFFVFVVIGLRIRPSPHPHPLVVVSVYTFIIIIIFFSYIKYRPFFAKPNFVGGTLRPIGGHMYEN